MDIPIYLYVMYTKEKKNRNLYFIFKSEPLKRLA